MKTYLAQGCGTYSKLKRNYAYNVPDTISSGGNGGISGDGHYWLDWSCGLGSNIMGWDNNYSLNSGLAEPVAKLLCKRFGFDKAKILQSGSAACDAAVRIARAHTGNPQVLWTGYHGCGNTFISCEEPGLGTIQEHGMKYETNKELIIRLKELLQRENGVFSETGESYDGHYVACVIIEPVKLEYSARVIKELLEIRELTKKLGIVLVFDEIITGMRFLKGSVSNETEIKPDLLCVGKAIGNGYPFSAVLGSEELMEQDYFISNTHNANDISLIHAEDMLKIKDSEIEKLWITGKQILFRANKILSIIKKAKVQLVGYPTRAEWQSDDLDLLTAIWEVMAGKGHVCGRAWFLNYQHDKVVTDKFLFDLGYAVNKINKGYERQGRCVSFSLKRN